MAGAANTAATTGSASAPTLSATGATRTKRRTRRRKGSERVACARCGATVMAAAMRTHQASAKCVGAWVVSVGLVRASRFLLPAWVMPVVKACDGVPDVYELVLVRALRDEPWFAEALEATNVVDGERALRPMVEEPAARRARLVAQMVAQREKDARRMLASLEREMEHLEKRVAEAQKQVRYYDRKRAEKEGEP